MPKASSIKRLLVERWQRDRVVLLLYLLTFFVMSYPFVTRMHSHLPMDNVDTHQALWQNWWVLEALRQGQDVNHSPYLFHPEGLDYTLQPPRWTGLVIWTPLYLLFGDPFAFNMTAAIGILLRAYGMYLFGMLIFKRRIPAWVCGAFYAFAGANLTHALQQPFTGASEWIPWFMLAFVYGLMRIRAGAGRAQYPLDDAGSGFFVFVECLRQLENRHLRHVAGRGICPALHDCSSALDAAKFLDVDDHIRAGQHRDLRAVAFANDSV